MFLVSVAELLLSSMLISFLRRTIICYDFFHATVIGSDSRESTRAAILMGVAEVRTQISGVCVALSCERNTWSLLFTATLTNSVPLLRQLV